MKCAFQILFIELLWALCREAQRACERFAGSGAAREIQLPQVDFLASAEIAERLWKKAIALCGTKYDSKHMTFSYDMEELLKLLPEDIDEHPPLAESFFQEIWGLVECDSDSFKDVIECLQTSVFTKLGMQPREGLEDKNFRGLIKAELRGMFETVIYDFVAEFKESADALAESDFVPCQLIGKLNYMFRETFADLQAIMLLEMNWDDYCGLLQREDGKKLIEDCPLRMLAVVKVLASRNKEFLPAVAKAEFQDVRNSVNLSIENEADTLAMRGFEPTYLYYLTDYLADCANAIHASLKDKEFLSQKLRELHKKLSDNMPLYSLQMEIQPFIEDYRKKLLSKDLRSF